MLLSFYDTYCDDNIIDEKYEQNSYLDENNYIFECNVSPGTKNDYFYDINFNNKNFTAKEYRDFDKGIYGLKFECYARPLAIEIKEDYALMI